MTTQYATCGFCHERVPLEDILLHLRVEHDFDEEPATWPDGDLVVIDKTLEPTDFGNLGEP